jgi:hypothetical protein
MFDESDLLQAFSFEHGTSRKQDVTIAFLSCLKPEVSFRGFLALNQLYGIELTGETANLRRDGFESDGPMHDSQKVKEPWQGRER